MTYNADGEKVYMCPLNPSAMQVDLGVRKRLVKICLSKEPCDELRLLLCERYTDYASEGRRFEEWVDAAGDEAGEERALAAWMDGYLEGFIIPVLRRHKQIIIWSADHDVSPEVGLRGASVILTEQAADAANTALAQIDAAIEKQSNAERKKILRDQLEILRGLNTEAFEPRPRSEKEFTDEVNSEIDRYRDLTLELDAVEP
jgi:hypothetical protein